MSTKRKFRYGCPKCGSKLRFTATAESDIGLPGIDCTRCDYSETYNPPYFEDTNIRS